MEDRVISAMQQLGFTATDAKAYIGLLKSHPATGYELAARTGVPRSAIYNVLGRLESLGLVNVVHEKPARYLPLKPDRLFEMLSARFSNSLGDLKGAIQGLSVRPQEAATWTLVGYRAMLEQASALVHSAEQRVVASLWAREAQALEPALQGALARGVDVVLFSFNPIAETLGTILSYGIPEDKLETYWRHKIILIADQSRLIVGGADQSDDTRSVVTEEQALVEMALSNLVLDITLYGQRTGRDTGQIISHLTAHLAPVEDLVEAALHQGPASGHAIA
ncbi:MAG: helix-turn-helix domain-containing protein [Pseudomonadota bacterium]